MKAVKVRDIIIGEGIPKICASITAKTTDEIIKEALVLSDNYADIAEWRIDYFEGVYSEENILYTLKELRAILKNIPLIFTFRNSKEGGYRTVNAESYLKLNKIAIFSGLIDIIDVEISKGNDIVKELISIASKSGVKVITSIHHFDNTPSIENMLNELISMQNLGSDILKLAVMPKSSLEVLRLLEALTIMYESYAQKPIIAISMSDIGVISRFTGEIFGSAVTFGALNTPSAPGQLKIETLHSILNLIHKAINE